MKSTRLRLAAVASLPLLALTACSSDSAGSTASGTSTAAGSSAGAAGASSTSAAAASTSGAGAATSAAAGGGTKTTISLLVDNSPVSLKLATAVVAAFEKANPEIKVTVESRPQGADGDNLVKTKLATGDMSDVFWYNSGALLQALAPAKTLVDLTNDPAIAAVDKSFLPVVSDGGRSTVRRGAAPSPAVSSTTRPSTPSSACRCRRRGPTSWPTATRSRRRA